MTQVDPNNIPQHQAGAKLDGGKPLAALVVGDFSNALQRVVDVGTFGANKYTRSGWLSVPDAESRYADAMMRHLLAHFANEKTDSDSGLPHLHHAAWNVLALVELQERSK